jgi:hypothetical protein
MPSLNDHQSSKTTKLLLIGDSGTGKTGALASLVEAGYNLRILDFDNGLDILANVLRAKGKPELLDRVNFQTVTDTSRIAGINMIPGAQAWNKAIKTLSEWPDGLGKLDTWGEKDILVVDSLTFAGKAAIRFVLSLNGRIGDLPQIQDYLTAQGLLEKLCATLYSDAIQCNVIVISHVREVAKTHQELDSKGRAIQVEEEGSRKGYVETGVGKALSPVVGRYFNSVLLADIEGSGPAARRIIRTVPHDNIGLKNSSPTLVKPKYDLKTGLAEFFAAVRGNPSTNDDKGN